MTAQKMRGYNAEEVAKYFIYLASLSLPGNEREGISNLKLQKILYFAQAYFLVKQKRPLFRNKIEAWAYGPVIPSVYRTYKKHGSNAIISRSDGSSLTEVDKEILKIVWNAFGGYSAGRLVEISHSHTPWKEAYESGDKVITREALRDYYAPLLS